MSKISLIFKGKTYSFNGSLLAGAMAELEAVLSDLESGSSGLVMNEYGFYFDVPYVYYEGNQKMSQTFFADGSVLTKGIYIDTGEVFHEVTAPAGSAQYSLNTVTVMPDDGAGEPLTIPFTDNGTKFELQGIAFVVELSGNIVIVLDEAILDEHILG